MRRWLAALETRLLDRHAANVARANPWPRAGAVTTKGATMTKNPLRSDPQPLAASERPLAPDAPNGLTSGPESYTDVIRGVYEAEEFLIQESVINRASLDTIIRLTRERDEALATIARMRTNRPASHTGLTERTS